MSTRASYLCRWVDPRVSLWQAMLVVFLVSGAQGQEGDTLTPSQPNAEPRQPATPVDSPPIDERRTDLPKLPPPADAQKLSPEFDIWIDKGRKLVLVDGQVTLRRGPLEMFACPKGTKEHESIVAANTKAFLVHAALLNLGAETGTPVRYDDTYHPPTGTKIAIDVYWLDEKGERKKARAQDWVRDNRTQKAMTLPWVFAGSGFWKDENTGEQFYMAEAGDLVCVSNFTTAMLDVPAESTQANDGLAFEAFTEQIPPLGTWVRMVLRPELPDEKPAENLATADAPANSDEPPAGSKTPAPTAGTDPR